MRELDKGQIDKLLRDDAGDKANVTDAAARALTIRIERLRLNAKMERLQAQAALLEAQQQTVKEHIKQLQKQLEEIPKDRKD